MARTICGSIILLLLIAGNCCAQERLPSFGNDKDLSILNDQNTQINIKTEDVEFSQDNIGIILYDRDDGTQYRVYVDSGSILLEEV